MILDGLRMRTLLLLCAPLLAPWLEELEGASLAMPRRIPGPRVWTPQRAQGVLLLYS